MRRRGGFESLHRVHRGRAAWLHSSAPDAAGMRADLLCAYGLPDRDRRTVECRLHARHQRDVTPKYGPSITQFLTNKIHYRISPWSQSTLATTASPAGPAKAYGSPPGAAFA